MINTVKSILRFYKSVISKYSPIKAKDYSIESIVNNIKCNDSFSFSGQPTKRQFSFIRKEGYEIIINLAPYDLLENPLKDEESIVTKLGMKYVHIPVNMLNPAQEDFDAFVNIMMSASNNKIWVHCAIGMRASDLYISIVALSLARTKNLQYGIFEKYGSLSEHGKNLYFVKPHNEFLTCRCVAAAEHLSGG